MMKSCLQRVPKSSKSHHGKDAPSSSCSTDLICSSSTLLQASVRGAVDPMWPCKACRASDATCKCVCRVNACLLLLEAQAIEKHITLPPRPPGRQTKHPPLDATPADLIMTQQYAHPLQARVASPALDALGCRYAASPIILPRKNLSLTSSSQATRLR